MRKFIYAISFILLAGCQYIPRDTASNQENKPPVFSELYYNDDDQELLEQIQAFVPSITWGQHQRTVYRDMILLDDDFLMPTATVGGVSLVANQAGLQDKQQEIDALLKNDKWKPEPLLDADGAAGGVWGYRKDYDEFLRRYLILLWDPGCNMEEPIEGYQCREPRSEVFLTDFFDPDSVKVERFDH